MQRGLQPATRLESGHLIHSTAAQVDVPTPIVHPQPRPELYAQWYTFRTPNQNS